ncbi:MAG: dihydroneopterin aldolase [Gammaproteobacteria bacterium]|nr:dihydroneopterin aldolase [Gammaproteobacteria bacterium]
MGLLKISQLKASTLLGVLPFEQRLKQTVIVDLEFKINVAQAAKQDSFHDTLDYSAVAEQLVHFLETHSFALIETLAEQAAEFLRHTFQLSWLKLKISKIGCLPCAKEVSLEIIREQ